MRSNRPKHSRKSKAEGEIRTRFVASTVPDSDINRKIGPFSNSPKADPKLRAGYVESASDSSNSQDLASLELRFAKKELLDYAELRLAGISKASVPWMKRNSRTFWDNTRGVISKERCDALPAHLAGRYTDFWAPRKVLNFATAFLYYLASTHFDGRYQAFDLFLELSSGKTGTIINGEMNVTTVLLPLHQRVPLPSA